MHLIWPEPAIHACDSLVGRQSHVQSPSISEMVDLIPPTGSDPLQIVLTRACLYGRGACADFALKSAALVKANPIMRIVGPSNVGFRCQHSKASRQSPSHSHMESRVARADPSHGFPVYKVDFLLVLLDLIVLVLLLLPLLFLPLVLLLHPSSFTAAAASGAVDVGRAERHGRRSADARPRHRHGRGRRGTCGTVLERESLPCLEVLLPFNTCRPQATAHECAVFLRMRAFAKRRCAMAHMMNSLGSLPFQPSDNPSTLPGNPPIMTPIATPYASSHCVQVRPVGYG